MKEILFSLYKELEDSTAAFEQMANTVGAFGRAIKEIRLELFPRDNAYKDHMQGWRDGNYTFTPQEKSVRLRVDYYSCGEPDSEYMDIPYEWFEMDDKELRDAQYEWMKQEKIEREIYEKANRDRVKAENDARDKITYERLKAKFEGK